MFWWERVRSAFSTVATYHSRNMMMLFSIRPISPTPRLSVVAFMVSHQANGARSQFLKSKSHSFSGCLFVFLYCLNNLHFIWFTLGVSRWTITTALCVPCCFSILPRQTQNTHRAHRVNLSSEVCKKLAPIWNSLMSSCEKMHAWQRRCAMCCVDKSRMKPPGG